MLRKKKIIVIPSAGLGNRLRVISSCIQVAIKQDRALWIIWPKNSALGCDIKDIFENIGIEYHVPSKWFQFLLIQIFRHGAIKRYFKIYKWFLNYLSIDTIFDEDMKYENQPHMEISSGNTTIVATCYSFGNKQDYNLYDFSNYIKKETDREFQKLSKSYIGVHIRRTDHFNLIKQSPLENYVAQIDKYIYINPQQKFFLATDDEETKTYLFNKYENRFYVFNHKLGRNSIDGVRGAVIELLLLSKSNTIICSSLSSYSDTAIFIGNIKNVINVDKNLDLISLKSIKEQN